MHLAIGGDHAGFPMKAPVIDILKAAGHTVRDFGTHSTEPVDFPDIARLVCDEVRTGKTERGILVCGTGVGACIAGNKIPGIRAALCHDELTAEMSRRHNNSNVLCLPADLIGEELMRRVVDVWLRTEYEAGRHERRIEKITAYEENGRCGG